MKTITELQKEAARSLKANKDLIDMASALLNELIKAREVRLHAQDALQWLEELPIDERERLEGIIEWDAPMAPLAQAIDNTEGTHAIIDLSSALMQTKFLKTYRENTHCRNRSAKKIPAGEQVNQVKKEDRCQICQDQGWILASDDEHGLRVERCDACCRLEDDNQAATAAWPVLSMAVEAVSLCREALTWLEDSFEDKEQPTALVQGLCTLCEAVRPPAD